MRINKLFWIGIIALSACKGKTTSEENAVSPVSESDFGNVVLCISDGVPLREEPKKDGKWISSLNMGETMTYLGKTEADPADAKQEFCYVELSDGKKAWARTYGVLIGAKPAAITGEAPIYKRPDLVTKTDKSFKTMEFVGIVTEKDDWVEVVGSNKTKKGWIQAQKITLKPEDIAVSTQAMKMLCDKDGNISIDKIPGFLEGLSAKNSQFVSYLEIMLDEKTSEAVEESIQDYEEGQEAEAVEPVEETPGN